MAPQDPGAPTDSNGSALVITAITFLTISWISVALRTYVRAVMLKGFLWDDWMMAIGQAIFTISCTFILVGCHYGLGRHNKSLSQNDEIIALKYQALATATYIIDMMFIKVSIGLFLLRIATQRRYIYTIWVSIAIIMIWSTVLFFWNLFQCNPVDAQWDYTILEQNKSARCVSADNVVSAAYALSVMTILSDWLYALLPIPMIWKVKMTMQAKATVIGILGLGIFASIATLIRLKFLADLTDLADILHAGTDAMVWTLIEPGVAITASSLVTIRPLLRALKVPGFQSTENSKPSTAPFGKDQPASRSRATNRTGSKTGSALRDSSITDNDVELGVSTSMFRSQQGSQQGGHDFAMKNHKSKMSNMSRISEGEFSLVDDKNQRDGILVTRRTDVHSMTQTEQDRKSPDETGLSWLANENSSSNSSIDLSPVHSQSDGRVGLGTPKGQSR